MKRILSVLFWVLATAAICQPQSIQYFPQIAEGVQPGGIQWGMLIAITNPSTTFASGTLALMKDDGTPFPIRFGQGGGQSGFENPNQPSITFQLPPGQTTVFTSPGESGQSTTSLQTGFAMLFSNPVPLSATVIFSEFAPGGRIAQAGVLSATPSTRQEIIAVAPSPQGPMNLYPANTETSASRSPILEPIRRILHTNL